MTTSSTCSYARKAIENATPRMLEKREIETIPAPLPLEPVDEAPAALPERVPLPLAPLFVGLEVDAELVEAARFAKSV